MLSRGPVKQVRGSCCLHPAERRAVLRNNVGSLPDHMTSHSVSRLSYHFANTVAIVPPLYWILFIMWDEWKCCAGFTWFISIGVENVVICWYWTPWRQLESKFRQVTHWVSLVRWFHTAWNAVCSNQTNVSYTISYIAFCGSITFLQLLSMHKLSLGLLLFEFQSSVNVRCFLRHLNVRNTGSYLKQNVLINYQTAPEG